MEQNIIDGLEPLPEAPPAPAPAPPAPPAEPAPDLLRVALSVEFLVALIAIPTAWSEIGGQGHLDLMPWYLKLALIVGSSWAVVKYSSALARTRRAGSRRSVLWLAAVLLITVGMGLVTYYYHLHEPDDQDDQDENPSASISIPRTPAAGGYL